MFHKMVDYHDMYISMKNVGVGAGNSVVKVPEYFNFNDDLHYKLTTPHFIRLKGLCLSDAS